MLVKTFCAAVMGLEATTVTVEVSMTRGVMFHLTGLADTAVLKAGTESWPLCKTPATNFPWPISP